jgi:hypothetical protein
VTPLGLGLSYADLRRLIGVQSHFGRTDVVRCPHFVEQTQGCAIWEARNAVCSTWFCQYERGAVSQRFWHAVRDLLIAVEEQVARRCLRGGGLPDEQVSAVLGHRAAIRETIRRANCGEPPDDVASDDVASDSAAADDESLQWYARMWGAWQGREEEWFARCAESVAGFDVGELAAQADDVLRLIEGVGGRRADLQRRELPDRVLFAPSPGTEATTDVLRLIGYSPFDPLILPADLEPSLWRLDGRLLAQVQAEIKLEHGVELGEELLVRLHDFAVAVAAQPQEDEPIDDVLLLGATSTATSTATSDDASDDAVRLPAVAANRQLDLDGEEIVIP